MNASDLQLWDVLVPARSNGELQATEDQIIEIGDFVVDLVGGYSLVNDKVKGTFQNAQGDLLEETSVVLRVAATLQDTTKIACFIKTTLKQESVMFYQVSPHAFFV